MDVWFDSGSMSFAQVHYPFENHDWFEHHFPGDFIVEYIGQTRGWFYTLHILATALFDRPAFSSCVSHGIVLGCDGQKMSKSLRNYPDVSEVFDRDGADAMRWFLMSSADPARRQPHRHRGGHPRRRAPGAHPALERWSFFSLYANAADGGRGYARAVVDGVDRRPRPLPPGQAARVRRRPCSRQMDAYEIAERLRHDALVPRRPDELVHPPLARPVLGRRGRVRAAAFDTLYTALETVCRVVAPLLPLTTEEIWRGLTGGRSVHLTDWPSYDDLPEDHALVASMDRAREVCSTASALRKANQLRARLPLASLTVVTADPAALRAVRRRHPRRGQRQGGPSGRPRRGRRGRVRAHPAAGRQRPRGRTAARPRGPDGDQGQQVRRLDRRRRRRGLRGRHPRSSPVSSRSSRSTTTASAGPARHGAATAAESSSSTRR